IHEYSASSNFQKCWWASSRIFGWPMKSIDAHYHFDDACFGFYPIRKCGDHFIEVRLMGNPGACVNPPFLDELDDSSEVGRERIAARQDGKFAAVHDLRVWESNLFLRYSHIHQPPGESTVIERFTHGLVASGSVYN